MVWNVKLDNSNRKLHIFKYETMFAAFLMTETEPEFGIISSNIIIDHHWYFFSHYWVKN
jgi:hypothetical protein